MFVNEFLANRSFGPEYLAVLSKAFDGACADLGVKDSAPHARTTVAKRMLLLADGQRDPEAIRSAVVSWLKATH